MFQVQLRYSSRQKHTGGSCDADNWLVTENRPAYLADNVSGNIISVSTNPPPLPPNRWLPTITSDSRLLYEEVVTALAAFTGAFIGNFIMM